MEKVRVYITEKEQGKPILFLISTYSSTPDMGSTLFLESSPDDFNYDSFELIDTPEHASYFLYPHPIRNDDEKRSTHFAQAKHAARAAGKPLLVFAGGDLAHDMYF
jgi:hypothetical protein